MIDRTVASIGKDTVTYREIEKRYLISKLCEGSKVYYRQGIGDSEFNSARQYVIHILLVNDHLKRIALKSPVSEADIESRKARIKELLGGVQAYDDMKGYFGIDDGEITDIVRGKMIADQFFEKSAALVEDVSEAEIREYYESQRDLFYDESYEEVRGYIKKYLLNTKVSRRNSEWLENQIRQREVKLID